MKHLLFKKLLLLIIALFSVFRYAKKTQIKFESNGRSQAEIQKNPFIKFIV